MIRQSKQSQQGVAVITVLLVIALGTIAITSMVSRQQLDIRREQNESVQQLGRALGVSGERFAAAVLFRDVKTGDRNNSDSLVDDWAQTLPPVPIDNASIQGCVVDLQGRFNINNLVTREDPNTGTDPQQIHYFDQLKWLLRSLQIDEVKAGAIKDWVDADIDTELDGGAEDDYYSALEKPYRTPNGPMASVTEMKLVKGFNPAVEEEREDYELLLPHIAALPFGETRTHINVNTATPAVMDSLQNDMVGASSELHRWETTAWEDYPECEDLFDLGNTNTGALAASDPRDPYEARDDFTVEAEGLLGVDDKDNPLFNPQVSYDVKSRYFQLRMDVIAEEVRITQYSLFEREETGTSRVIYRSHDTL